MKRYRHYSRGGAIVLACFGSIVEERLYLDLHKEVAERFAEFDVFLSFSSRMVLKILQERGKSFKTLPQVLADVDRAGYKRVVVASVNLFPTDEHAYTRRIVEGFRHFTPANLRLSDAILSRSKETTLFLQWLDRQLKDPEWANLYIIHGTPRLDVEGIDSIDYSSGYLKMLGSNYTCSLEGAYPYDGVKEQLIEQMKRDGVQRLRIVPMLLVSGNHYVKDMVEIREEMREHFDCEIVESLSEYEKFNLIELDPIRKIIFGNIETEIVKLGC